jgi:sporulation protein YlmC with PRC-barrel domain
MKRHKRHVVCAGLISAVISTVLVEAAFAGWSEGTAFLVAESSMQGSGSGPPGAVTTPVDKHTDLTGDQPGIPNEYSGTPVQQGKLQEVTDSKWLQKPVHGMQGEIVGKITQVLKDQKTGEIEYVILEPSDSKMPIPLRWSQFEEKDDQLRLKIKKEDLKKVLNAPNTKDMSPDIQEHMNHIERARSQPKAGSSQGSATSSPAAGGEHGESETSRGGASGSQALPQGQAPGLEGDHPSSKR